MNLLTEGHVKTHAFLDRCTERLLRRIEEVSSETSLPAGEVIFREGECANRMFLLLEGAVTLEITSAGCPPAIVMTLGPGDILGWSWLFPPFRYHFTARVISPCTALEVDGAALLVSAEEDPALGYELMKRVAQQLIRRLESTRKCLIRAARREVNG